MHLIKGGGYTLYKYYHGAGETADIRSFPNGTNKYGLHNERSHQEIEKIKKQVQEIKVGFLHFARTGFFRMSCPPLQGLTSVSYCSVVFMYRTGFHHISLLQSFDRCVSDPLWNSPAIYYNCETGRNARQSARLGKHFSSGHVSSCLPNRFVTARVLTMEERKSFGGNYFL